MNEINEIGEVFLKMPVFSWWSRGSVIFFYILYLLFLIHFEFLGNLLESSPWILLMQAQELGGFWGTVCEFELPELLKRTFIMGHLWTHLT